MPEIFRDDFDRPDSTSLGPDWYDIYGQGRLWIVSNAVRPEFLPNSNFEPKDFVYQTLPIPNDQYAEVLIVNLVKADGTGIFTSPNDAGLILRSTIRFGHPSTSYYQIIFRFPRGTADPNNYLIFDKYNSGQGIRLLTQVYSSDPSGSILRAEAIGHAPTILNAYINNILIATVEDFDGFPEPGNPEGPSSGQPGLSVQHPSPRPNLQVILDNFRTGGTPYPLVVAPIPPCTAVDSGCPRTTSDIEVLNSARGFIQHDRSFPSQRYRLYVAGGKIGIEQV